MSRPVYRLALTILAGSGLLSCGGGGGGGSSEPSRTLAKAASSGNLQVDTVTRELANPLRVLVTKDGAPEEGVTVGWSVTAGGGSVNPATSPTGVDGIASTSWTLGELAGTQNARATLSGAGGSPQTFSATAQADLPDTLLRATSGSGNAQSGTVNSALALPLRALVRDQFLNGVSGETVAWVVTSGDATLSDDNTVTDASGVASVSVTLGPTAGSVEVTASHADLTATAVFTATATIVPITATVTVGNQFFRSARNPSSNPAVDTIAAGGMVTWTWAAGAFNHNIISTGTLTFPNEGNSGTTFNAPHNTSHILSSVGTYSYHCSIHGTATTGMHGRIIVVSP